MQKSYNSDVRSSRKNGPHRRTDDADTIGIFDVVERPKKDTKLNLTLRMNYYPDFLLTPNLISNLKIIKIFRF